MICNRALRGFFERFLQVPFEIFGIARMSAVAPDLAHLMQRSVDNSNDLVCWREHPGNCEIVTDMHLTTQGCKTPHLV